MRNRLLSVPQFIALFIIVIGALTLARLADDAHELYAFHQQVQTLEQNKAAIESEIADIRADLDAAAKPDGIELAVRKMLGWTRPNETLVVVRSASGAIGFPSPTRTDALAGGEATHWQEWVYYLLGLNP